ncbi:hypothetical protein KBC54_04045 [Patescibacteria group bacterium]|nr:hypothetical protein [Patescibacteria group bacterium]
MMKFEQPSRTERPKLTLVKGFEGSEDRAPRLSPLELEKICSLKDIGSSYDVEQLRKEPKRFADVWRVLMARPFATELPIEEETFGYKRNLKECESLKKCIARLEARDMDLDDPEVVDALEKTLRLANIEQKKANWLEDEFYPKVFGKAIASARAEVNQFLIRQANTKGLEQFKDAGLPRINMQDTLNYVLFGHDPKTAGVSFGDVIAMNIPEWYTDKDEWRVYLVAVHELLHSVSHRNHEGVGMDKRRISPDLEALNEAVTQILTFRIASEHLEKEKTGLRGQRQQKLSLATMPYSEYTVLVREIFTKIPMDYFTDAMLNDQGWDRLRDKFREVFGNEDAVIRFAENLRNVYLSPAERKAKKMKGLGEKTVNPFGNTQKIKQNKEEE